MFGGLFSKIFNLPSRKTNPVSEVSYQKELPTAKVDSPYNILTKGRGSKYTPSKKQKKKLRKIAEMSRKINRQK